MNKDELKTVWQKEEDIAHIKGWDFSHLRGRYAKENDWPWDYDALVRRYLKPDLQLLDYDTGGGEYLLSLRHPYQSTAATEGYPPNVDLCRERLLPLGIDLKECRDPSHVPFADSSFDMIVNRHGRFDPVELYRLLRSGGLFVTEQIGGDNDRDLVKAVLPHIKAPYPDLYLDRQKPRFIEAGFNILDEGEAYRRIYFYDVGAFVWFARIIEWEFPGFTVDACFNRLLELQKTIGKNGKITGTMHRYMLVAQKR